METAILREFTSQSLGFPFGVVPQVHHSVLNLLEQCPAKLLRQMPHLLFSRFGEPELKLLPGNWLHFDLLPAVRHFGGSSVSSSFSISRNTSSAGRVSLL